MRFVRNPVVQYLAIAVVLFVALSVATSVLSARVAATEARADARSVTQVLARSVAQPAIPKGLVDGDAGAIDKLDRQVLDRLLVGDVRRVKIWRGDGTILYSDETRLIGARYPLDEEESRVLEGGGTEAEVSDLTKPENRYETAPGGLVEVYTRIHSPEGEPMLFELYFSADDIAKRRAQVLAPFQRITIGGLLAMLVVATPIIWVLTRRLTRTAPGARAPAARHHDASEAERRRIARDLHDGVVQDLAGTAFSLTAIGRDERVPDDVRQRTRRRRAVLAHQPQGAALAARRDPSAGPARRRADGGPDRPHRAGRDGEHRDERQGVADLGRVPDETVALVWRVAQEAVRNAIRHAHASTLDVDVHRSDGHVVLQVTDDGDGFEPDADRDPGSFGLRGLASLVEDAGGRLDVRSTPGEGTQVRMEVGVR